jgi:hypothetical protein
MIWHFLLGFVFGKPLFRFYSIDGASERILWFHSFLQLSHRLVVMDLI